MSAPKPVVVMGGTGSGLIAAGVIQDINAREPEWEFRGFLNDVEDIGTEIGGYPVVGRTGEAPDFAARGVYVHYAMRNPKYAHLRIERFKAMDIPPEAFATFVHPNVQLTGSAGIGHGSLLAAQTYLSVGARVNNHNHLYGNAFVGHDSVVEDFAWVGTGAAVGARCVIGMGSHLGTNCSLREDVTIGRYALVGVGAVVVKDVADMDVVAGNPARVMGSVSVYTDDPSDPGKPTR